MIQLAACCCVSCGKIGTMRRDVACDQATCVSCGKVESGSSLVERQRSLVTAQTFKGLARAFTVPTPQGQAFEDRLPIPIPDAMPSLSVTYVGGCRIVKYEPVTVTAEQMRRAEESPLFERMVAEANGRVVELAAIQASRDYGFAPVLPPVDPLDVIVEPGRSTLRSLLAADEAMRREGPVDFPFHPAQRAAVSAHWSAELRARVSASVERERNRVLVDLQDE